jgi:type VI secretion system secreted protein VgrG
MPSAKDGSPGTIVPPTDADVAEDANDADPGAVEAVKTYQRETKTGRYGSEPVDPHTNDPETTDPDTPPKTSWIEVQLIDDESNPVAGARYTVTMSDGTVWDSSTDDKGVGRVDGIDPGSCDISFPDLDQDAWEPA